MLNNKLKFILVLGLFFGSLFFSSITKANVDWANRSCGNAPDGFKNAIFVVTSNIETDSDANPVDGTAYCVLLSWDKNSAFFADLVKVNALPQDLLNKDANIQVYASDYSSGVCSDFAWEERKFLDYKAYELNYQLSAYILGDSCVQSSLSDQEVGLRTRYRVETKKNGFTTQNVYVYFIGIAKNDASGASVQLAPFDLCWGYDSDQNGCFQNSRSCFWYPITGGHSCQHRQDTGICSKITNKDLCDKSTKQGSLMCTWNEELKQCQKPTMAYTTEQNPVPTGYVEGGGILPPCAFSGNCNNVNDLLQLAVNAGNWFFKIIGAAAFVMFVYGGFTVLLSFGNAEKVKTGWKILGAAVVGIIIAFSAYLLIDFILTTLNVAPEFRAITR